MEHNRKQEERCWKVRERRVQFSEEEGGRHREKEQLLKCNEQLETKRDFQIILMEI